MYLFPGLKSKKVKPVLQVNEDDNPEETQDEKAQGPEMRIRGMISVSSNSCTFPYVESPQFLSLRYLVFLNWQSSLMFRLSAPFVANFYIP